MDCGNDQFKNWSSHYYNQILHLPHQQCWRSKKQTPTMRCDTMSAANRNLTEESNCMNKAIVTSVIAIVLGYFGSALGYEIMNWPQLGPILAIIVMGSAILTSLERDK